LCELDESDDSDGWEWCVPSLATTDSDSISEYICFSGSCPAVELQRKPGQLALAAQLELWIRLEVSVATSPSQHRRGDHAPLMRAGAGRVRVVSWADSEKPVGLQQAQATWNRQDRRADGGSARCDGQWECVAAISVAAP
jgi:hypothetical protein